MNLLLIILSLSFLKDKIILSTTGSDFLNDITLYMNELCSHNGIPQLTKNKTEVICECDKDIQMSQEKAKKDILIINILFNVLMKEKEDFYAFFFRL